MSEISTTLTPVHETKMSPRGRKAVLAGAVGNTVEWVDWAVYTTFSSVFARQFFPPGDPAAALLSTLAIFAVGFLMRPVGAAILGAYADRNGRKKSLVLTISMMAGAALVIGLTPTYETIGIFAPIILVAARMIQGFSAGGEFGSSSAFLVESAAPKRRAFAASWQQVSVGAGILIASAMGAVITSLLTPEDLQSWGWRLAFVLAALLGVVGLWLRSSVEETESFENVKAKLDTSTVDRHSPLTAIFKQHPKQVLRVFGITVAGTLLYYMWVSYLPTYAAVTSGIALSQALTANVIGILIFITLLPFAGILSDKVGRKPLLIAFAGSFILFLWPAFNFLDGSFWRLLVVQVVGLILLLGYSANSIVVMAEQFPAEVRVTGIGVPYSLAVAIFGGTAPYITTWMNSSGLGSFVWLYCAIGAAIGLVVYIVIPETKGKVLD